MPVEIFWVYVVLKMPQRFSTNSCIQNMKAMAFSFAIHYSLLSFFWNLLDNRISKNQFLKCFLCL